MWVDAFLVPEDPLALAREAVTVEDRRAVARRLGEVAHTQVSPALGLLDRLLADDDADLRRAVARATWSLARRARPAELVPIAGRLVRDDDAAVRRLGLRALLDCRSVEADAVLARLDLAGAGRWLTWRVRLRCA